MKKKLFMTILIAMIVNVSVYGKVMDTVEAYIVDTPIYKNNDLIETTYPLLSYNGYTYIAVRDMGEVMDKRVTWGAVDDDEGNIIGVDDIILCQKQKEEYPVSKEVAFAIGKAVINEVYSDKINDTTIYAVEFCRANSFYVDSVYEISAKFNTVSGYDEIEENYHGIRNADVIVRIDPDTGAYMIR